MKTVRNKTHRPLRIHLAQDRVLHLGPDKDGQIATHDIERPGVMRLVESGQLEILGEGASVAAAGPESGHVHTDTHGHHPDVRVTNRGDR